MSKDDVDVVISSVVGNDAGGKTSTTIIRRAVKWKSESEIRTLIVGLLAILVAILTPLSHRLSCKYRATFVVGEMVWHGCKFTPLHS
jgi:hypothetical protein